ncbi:MAG: NADH-quinone oxidoreductase subunit H [Myxococcota bacterium]|jgi:NADH-quinone oxidoreductase subunit H|nr:NADH-quinone oxidoreductase subunit H [Myxococcota bacterium]
MLIETLIILLKISVVILGFVLSAGGLMTLIERKQSALIQNRVGPNRANLRGHLQGEAFSKSLRLGGLFHMLADSLKMLFKEDIIPAKAHKLLFQLAPMIMLFPALVLFAVIPWTDQYCPGGALLVVNGQDVCFEEPANYFSIAELDVGLLYVFAIASLSIYGIAIGGWASNNKYSLLGALRASAQMLSYEVPMALSILGIVLIYGSLNLNEIAREQGELLFGILPKWGVFLQPVALLLFFTASLAENKRAPFDLPEAESEISHGYNIEYTGLKFGMFMLAEFIGPVFIGALIATLFFGGWQVPYLYGDGFRMPFEGMYVVFALLFLAVAAYFASVGYQRRQRLPMVVAALFVLHVIAFAVMAYYQKEGVLRLPYPVVMALRIGAMMTKIALLTWLQFMLRWTLPRFRYDQIMRLGWKVLLPLALLNLLVTAILYPIFAH